MKKKDLLLEVIENNVGVITTKEVLEHGFHKDTLKALVVDGKLEKVATGLYALPHENIDEYLYFTHRIKKGVFSHETAAYLQGLTTKIPCNYVMTIMAGDNVSRVTKLKDNINFKYVDKELFEIGKVEQLSPFGRMLLTYDKERTVLDIIRDKDRIEGQIFRETIRTYFLNTDKNILKLSQYAVSMNMEDELTQYTEIML